MDPQTRVLLEEAHVALSRAEAATGPLADTRTGVYLGCMYQEYIQLMTEHGHRVTPALCTGNGISFMVGRVSYTFGLQVRGFPSPWPEISCS
jgi:acyl transferase domain-containing protein